MTSLVQITGKANAPVGLNQRNFSLSHGCRRRIAILSTARSHGAHRLPGILKFPPTHDTNLVSMVLDSEYAAEFVVMTSEQRPEYPQ